MIDLNAHSDDILSRFKAGEGLTSIARSYSVYEQRIRNLITKLTGETPKRIYSGDPDYFKVIDTHLKAYFLGFIAGDGCVTGVRRTLTITLNSKDICILEKFCEEIGSARGPYDLGSKNQVRFTHTSAGMADNLSQYGIGPRKSLTMEDFISEVPEQFRNSAILGLFDADGCISVRDAPYKDHFHRKQAVQIRCTVPVALAVVKESQVDSYHLSMKDAIPNLAISSLSNVRKFYAFIYKDCPFFLKRKHDKFLPILDLAQTISSPSVSS